VQHNCQFHYRHAEFSSQFKSKIGSILPKDAALRITLNIDDTPLASRSHTHPSQSLSVLAFSLSLHRHSNKSLLLRSRFIVS
jgi:hypothetical protein